MAFTVVHGQTSDINPNMIRLGRQARGISISALARAIGLTSHQLQWIEQGKMPLPPEAAASLCQALNYPPNFFIVEDTELWPPQSMEDFRPHAWYHVLASGIPAEAQIRHNTFVCEPLEAKLWREFEEREAARCEGRREVNRLRRRVAELEAQIESHSTE